ncbi:MAG: TIGR00341 family protein [Legionellaceae bacterium]|nr:TIGR00341 family protein [Legionellaceae bacterium]
MALRLIETILQKKNAENVHKLLAAHPILEHRELQLLNGEVLVRILLDAEHNEAVLDLLEEHYAKIEGYRVVILPVEATLPRAEELPVDNTRGQKTPERIAREELYEDIKKEAQCSWFYMAMVTLSTIVAAVGLQNNSVAIIIGAMVIAPMLGPSIALALGTTLGDLTLLRRAILTGLAGIGMVIVLSTILGTQMHIDPAMPEIASRTRLAWGDIIVALASGCAGALAFTSGVSATLIGVMVAVALLPPLVVCGLLLGSGYWSLATAASSLFLMNLICVNIAGVLIFLVQGIHPLNWWEKDRAKKATRIASGLWVGMLAILILVVLLFRKI